jgi:hypothetical protein
MGTEAMPDKAKTCLPVPGLIEAVPVYWACWRVPAKTPEAL